MHFDFVSGQFTHRVFGREFAITRNENMPNIIVCAKGYKEITFKVRLIFPTSFVVVVDG